MCYVHGILYMFFTQLDLLLIAAIKHTGRTPKLHKPASSDYTSFGVDYSRVPTEPAPPKTSYKPPPPPPQRPVNAAPDEPDTGLGPPVWSNTLRSSNIPKPWEAEQQDSFMEDPQRCPPAVQPKPGVRPPQSPPQRQITVRSVPNGPPPVEDGPKIVHLQYNSPMGLYSRENIQDTYTGQTQGSPHQ